MELAEKTQTTEEPTLREALKTMIDSNPNGGEITLDEFAEKVPHSTRSECVRALKRSGAGVFITGRRGKVSRFVYGPPAIPFLTRTAPTKRENATPRPARQPQEENRPEKPSKPQPPTPAASKPQASVSPQPGQGFLQFELRVGIGDQITSIPVKIALGMAA